MYSFSWQQNGSIALLYFVKTERCYAPHQRKNVDILGIFLENSKNEKKIGKSWTPS